MISIIIALIIIALTLWALISGIKGDETGAAIVVAFIILAFGNLFGIIVPTAIIAEMRTSAQSSGLRNTRSMRSRSTKMSTSSKMETPSLRSLVIG